jgi:phage terminase large subunit
LSTLRIPTAKIFEPLLAPARYKGVYGGRGSGKSHFFGELLVETCQAERGTSAVCIREAQRSLAQSSKRLIESKIAALGLGHQFKVFSDKIATPGDGIIIFRGMQDHTSESIKSLEGFQIAWVDEAQNLSARSLSLLRPTIRAKGSELWASWNPRRKSDAMDDFFRTKKPDGAILVNANWRDNPWFPAVLEDERKTDLSLYPDRYDHIDAIIDARAEAVAKECPGVPLGVIRNLLTARAPACACTQYLELSGEGQEVRDEERRSPGPPFSSSGNEQ